ncbi:hypothetical protein C8R44DRAFT_753022 [Mycena epipterygia]|nr:hypothetical protein C8R44DRAFT_753022 [Mycena epipterygia]
MGGYREMCTMPMHAEPAIRVLCEPTTRSWGVVAPRRGFHRLLLKQFGDEERERQFVWHEEHARMMSRRTYPLKRCHNRPGGRAGMAQHDAKRMVEFRGAESAATRGRWARDLAGHLEAVEDA